GETQKTKSSSSEETKSEIKSDVSKDNENTANSESNSDQDLICSGNSLTSNVLISNSSANVTIPLERNIIIITNVLFSMIENKIHLPYDFEQLLRKLAYD